jgi:hypothetical protein
MAAADSIAPLSSGAINADRVRAQRLDADRLRQEQLDAAQAEQLALAQRVQEQTDAARLEQQQNLDASLRTDQSLDALQPNTRDPRTNLDFELLRNQQTTDTQQQADLVNGQRFFEQVRAQVQEAYRVQTSSFQNQQADAPDQVERYVALSRSSLDYQGLDRIDLSQAAQTQTTGINGLSGLDELG